MIGTCEFLMVLTIWDGGASLQSECSPAYVDCQARIRELIAEHPGSSSIGQCVEIGGLVGSGRRRAK